MKLLSCLDINAIHTEHVTTLDTIEKVKNLSLRCISILLSSFQTAPLGFMRSSFVKILSMNRPEWRYILFGCLACLCNGGLQPAVGVTVSKLIAVS